MSGGRIPGPVNGPAPHGRPAGIAARTGHLPGPIGDPSLSFLGKSDGGGPAARSAQERTDGPGTDSTERDRAQRAPEPVAFPELMRGLELSVYDRQTGVVMNANSFDWRVPFRTRSGRWIIEPRPIENDLRTTRTRIIELLEQTMLAKHIGGMLRRTQRTHREHKAYITDDGNIGGMIYGGSHHVANLTVPTGVEPVAEIHTHPLSRQLAPPSFREDFRRNMLQLVAECAHGRLWIAAWPNLALLIGQIVAGAEDDRSTHFRPIASTDRRCDLVWHMSDYVPASRRIPDPG